MIESLVFFERFQFRKKLPVIQEFFQLFDVLFRRCSIFFRKYDIKSDGPGAGVVDLLYQIGNNGSRPRPLAQLFKALFIDIDDDHRIGGRHRTPPPEHGIDDMIVKGYQKSRFVLAEGIKKKP